MLSIHDHLDLYMFSKFTSSWQSITYCHGTIVNKESVKLLQSLRGAFGTRKDNGSFSTAFPVLPILKFNFLDGSYRLDEIFLSPEILISQLEIVLKLHRGVNRYRRSDERKIARIWQWLAAQHLTANSERTVSISRSRNGRQRGC